MCLAFGCLPQDLEDLDEQTYQLFKQFMRVERDAGRLKGMQQQFYG